MSVSLGSGRGRQKKKRTANNMNKTSIDIIGGVIAVIIGLVFAIFHRQLAHKTADFYYRFLHVQFGEKGYKIGFLLFGIVFIIFGFLAIFQVVRFK